MLFPTACRRACLALALVVGLPGLARAATLPNVVFILGDELGRGELDALAARGMRLTQHYAGSAAVAASRGVLQTGRHPGHAAIRGDRGLPELPLPGPELTIAEVLKPLGYATAAIGSWELGAAGSEGDPLRQGFDEYAPDRTWERAAAFIREKRERPFFLYLSPPAAHAEGRAAAERELGRILDLLAELGLEERTIVALTSDPPGFARTGGPDGGLQVRAIVIWKGRVAKAAASDRVTGFEDWLPTLVELVGAAPTIPPRVDGVSFAPTLLGQAQEPRAFLYRELAGNGGQQMVREGHWTGVRQGLAQATAPRLELYDLASDVSQRRNVAARHPDVVARLEALLAREHQPSPFFPLPAIDPKPEGYLAQWTSASVADLISGTEAPWAAAKRVQWGPDALATAFAALWSAGGLAVRFDVTDASPWHTLEARDERLWTEEVVELFLDVGATRRSYAEIEWNPVNAVVDLWIDRALNRFDRVWNVAGLESRVTPMTDAAGRATGWSAFSFIPWGSLAAKAPAGTALPPRAGERWRFNAYRIERPGGPADPEKGVLYFPWAPTGQHSFHVPEAFREIEFAEPCQEATRVAMGSAATIRACGPDPAALAEAVTAGLDEVDRLDALLSHYRDDTPLSRLNREAAAGPVAVEPELAAFLGVCLRWSRESEGAFDVTVGPLMKLWGFFRDEGRLPRRLPDEAQIRSALDAVGYRHVAVDEERHTVRFDRPGVELDLGGIGKGYAADRVVELLRRRGIASALVNLGGSSVYGLGTPPGASGWQVSIADPRAPDRKAASVSLRDRALSVSGGYARFFEKDDIAYSHIMDPLTGRPVQGVLSVAVLSASATDGDALDDVLFVQGLERARAFVARLPQSTRTSVYFFLPSAGAGWRLECFGTQGAD